MIVKVQFIDTAYSSENVPSHLINDSDKISVLKENGFKRRKNSFNKKILFYTCGI
uniref:Uncharacterized protein n=1 Tax=Rhizophagus irregularis (strain DAOM 181602 / DAOM 197198 / MUCL 43194) TaxID=747089 RepID=U9UQA2_RHIID